MLPKLPRRMKMGNSLIHLLIEEYYSFLICGMMYLAVLGYPRFMADLDTLFCSDGTPH